MCLQKCSMLGVPELNTASTISTYKGSTPEYDRVTSEATQKNKSTSKNSVLSCILYYPFYARGGRIKDKELGRIDIQYYLRASKDHMQSSVPVPKPPRPTCQPTEPGETSHISREPSSRAAATWKLSALVARATTGDGRHSYSTWPRYSSGNSISAERKKRRVRSLKEVLRERWNRERESRV
nr:hypothetical protein Iba_chr14fCG11670 [Ipomoea batatas]